VPFKGSLFSAFGSAVHATAEYIFEDKRWLVEKEVEELPGVFLVKFEIELESLVSEGVDLSTKENKELIEQMKESGFHIAKYLVPEMVKEYGEFEVLGIEEELRMPVPEHQDWDFLGYIDLIIKTKDDKVKIIDFKTCSWGWGSSYKKNPKVSSLGPNIEENWLPSSAPGKKSDKMVAYQLVYYKHYWMEKHGYKKNKDVDTIFVLLKRTPGKKDNGELKNPVEFFRVTSGKKKIENALNLLNEAVYNISHKRYWKNRLSCQRFGGYKECVFNMTEYCKRG
jgi:hypothetical protein